MIEIINSGNFTTIQDEGRFGNQHNAYPICGALDIDSLHNANLLVDNPINNPVLECNITGCSILFKSRYTIALTGADMQWELDGSKIARYRTITVRQGQQLIGKNSIDGMRAYIAVSGQWDIPFQLNSYSSDIMNGLGFQQGKLLKRGDRIKVTSSTSSNELKLGLPNFNNISSLYATKGPDWELLNLEEQIKLTSHKWQISTASNRMGSQLKGAILEQDLKSINSRIVFKGIIQWPPGGSPIVLLNDCQTTGGFPRVAILEQKALNQFVQLPFHHNFKLKWID